MITLVWFFVCFHNKPFNDVAGRRLSSEQCIAEDWFAEDQRVIQCTEDKLRPAKSVNGLL
jgi:hypothetical protein